MIDKGVQGSLEAQRATHEGMQRSRAGLVLKPF